MATWSFPLETIYNTHNNDHELISYILFIWTGRPRTESRSVLYCSDTLVFARKDCRKPWHTSNRITAPTDAWAGYVKNMSGTLPLCQLIQWLDSRKWWVHIHLTIGRRHGLASVIVKELMMTGWKSKILGYMSSGESVPDVITTVWNRSNTGLIAIEESKQLEQY